jgi:hypothetical protein
VPPIEAAAIEPIKQSQPECPVGRITSKFDYLFCNRKEGELEELFLVIDRRLKKERDLLQDSKVEILGDGAQSYILGAPSIYNSLHNQMKDKAKTVKTLNES